MAVREPFGRLVGEARRTLELVLGLTLCVSPLLLGCGGKTALYAGSRARAGGTGSGGSGSGGSGGAGAVASSGGTGAAGAAALPMKTNKLDLLFVVDNSAYMGDEQTLLARSAAMLLTRLVNPPCVDRRGQTVTQPNAPGQPCPANSTRASAPVRDMHVGVITSSLGDHGANKACVGPGADDGAHLIPFVRDIDVADSGSGFLAWQPDQPGALDSPEVLIEDTETMLLAAGETGCGYEAPLEAMYRFLVDPSPPAEVVKVDDQTVTRGVDKELLEERASFLRPDSALAIVLVSDENDCSIRESGDAWRVTDAFLPRGTSACANDPYDRCCVSCKIGDNPEGCPSREVDPACAAGWRGDGQGRIRCWDQKRRLGIDFLHPVTRYVAGLLDEEICPDSTAGDNDCGCRHADALGDPCEPGDPVRNPIYDNLGADDVEVRDSSRVFFLTVTGVPWQDIATADSTSPDVALRYRRGNDIDWSLILGDPDDGTAPEDALMIESITPRDGPPHPMTGVPPKEPRSPYGANPINGHEWSVQAYKGLQYACVFDILPLLGGEARDCDTGDEETDDSCECSDPTDFRNELRLPLCQVPTVDEIEYVKQQYAAGALPSVRELEVARGVGEMGLVGSICPKQLEGMAPDDVGYGYNPAMLSLVESLAAVLE